VEICERDASGSGQEQVGGSCEHGSKLSDSIKGEGFIDQLSDCLLVKKDFIPWN
jgi:hypothetical protein